MVHLTGVTRKQKTRSINCSLFHVTFSTLVAGLQFFPRLSPNTRFPALATRWGIFSRVPIVSFYISFALVASHMFTLRSVIGSFPICRHKYVCRINNFDLLLRELSNDHPVPKWVTNLIWFHRVAKGQLSAFFSLHSNYRSFFRLLNFGLSKKRGVMLQSTLWEKHSTLRKTQNYTEDKLPN